MYIVGKRDTKMTSDLNYDSVEFAKFLISRANHLEIPINQTQLQKMLYIAYGFYKAKGETLLDERPAIWPFGPMFTQVHRNVSTNRTYRPSLSVNEEVTDAIDKIIQRYSRFTATKLSNWSHAEGSPWELTVKEKGYSWDTPIDDNLIIKYFSDKEVL